MDHNPCAVRSPGHDVFLLSGVSACIHVVLGAAAVCELEHSQMKQIFDGLLGDDIEARLRKPVVSQFDCATAAAFLPSLSGVGYRP